MSWMNGPTVCALIGGLVGLLAGLKIARKQPWVIFSLALAGALGGAWLGVSI